MFSLETIERNVSRNRGLVTALAAANNVVVVGTNRGIVVRYDFAEGGVTGALFGLLLELANSPLKDNARCIALVDQKLHRTYVSTCFSSAVAEHAQSTSIQPRHAAVNSNHNTTHPYT
eukprot:9492501-Pyramimonas_sp.AAC.2